MYSIYFYLKQLNYLHRYVISKIEDLKTRKSLDALLVQISDINVIEMDLGFPAPLECIVIEIMKYTEIKINYSLSCFWCTCVVFGV